MPRRNQFFALEAEPNEIESRIKYQILADSFFRSLRKDFPHIHLNYLDWYYGKFEADLGKVEDEIDILMKDLYPNLWTYYRPGDFTIHEFERQFLAIQDNTDLVVIDHLHYFDFEDDQNENRAMKATVKKIRDLAILVGKPVILVAHMRKSDRRLKQVVPDLDDFHGSSDIAKIATKAVILAPGPRELSQGNVWPTYMRVAKCRIDGARTKFIGLSGFNANTNKYNKHYYLGRLSPGEDQFEGIKSFSDFPYWAKSTQLFTDCKGT